MKHSYQFFVQDSQGNIQPNATVEVRRNGSLVSIYSDSDGAPKQNPFQADSNAYALFYADSGTYDITATFGAGSVEFVDVGIGAVESLNVVNRYYSETDVTQVSKSGRVFGASVYISRGNSDGDYLPPDDGNGIVYWSITNNELGIIEFTPAITATALDPVTITVYWYSETNDAVLDLQGGLITYFQPQINDAISSITGENIGLYGANPTYTNYNQYTTYDRASSIERWYLNSDVPIDYMVDSTTYPDPADDLNLHPSNDQATILQVIARQNGVVDSSVVYLAEGVVSGVNYFYDTSTQTDYYSPVTITGNLTAIGIDVDGVRTIEVDAVPYVITSKFSPYEPCFQTVNHMISSCSAPPGEFVSTNEFASGDGGSARYLIVDSSDFVGVPDELGEITLDNGNIAVIQISGSTVYTSQFGASQGSLTNIASVNAARDKADALGLRLSTEGRIIPIESKFTLSADTRLDGFWLILIDSFPDPVAVDSSTGTPGVSPCRDVIVDCNNNTAKGIAVDRSQNVSWDIIKVFNHRDVAIDVLSGYEFTLSGYETIGSDKLAGFPPVNNTVSGLRINTSDSHISDGVSVRTPRGLTVVGGNNNFTRIHNWSVYDVGQQPMLFCFYIDGENNSFIQCTADSPDLLNRGFPASPTNGGYGFYVSDDQNASNTKFTDCTVIIPNHANAPVSLLIPVHIGKSFCDVDVTYIDRTAAAIAQTIEYASTTVARDTRISGGNVALPRGRSGDFVEYPLTIAAGGSSTGYTYVADRAKARLTYQGCMVKAAGYVRLASKGGGVGDVTIEGLPTSKGITGAFKWTGTGAMSNPNVDIVRCEILQNDNSVYLIKPDGTRIQDSDVSINSEFYFTIEYEWDSPFD